MCSTASPSFPNIQGPFIDTVVTKHATVHRRYWLTSLAVKDIGVVAFTREINVLPLGCQVVDGILLGVRVEIAENKNIRRSHASGVGVQPFRQSVRGLGANTIAISCFAQMRQGDDCQLPKPSISKPNGKETTLTVKFARALRQIKLCSLHPVQATDAKHRDGLPTHQHRQCPQGPPRHHTSCPYS